MGTVRRKRIVFTAFMSLSQLFVLHEALADGHLDLRAPSHVSVADESTAAFADSANRRFMSSRAASLLEASGAVSGAWGSRAAAALNARASHIMSPMETLAHNFRKQGLPVARLFESKDSLVHLGFDQRGKPGLWILHRLH